MDTDIKQIRGYYTSSGKFVELDDSMEITTRYLYGGNLYPTEEDANDAKISYISGMNIALCLANVGVDDAHIFAKKLLNGENGHRLYVALKEFYE